MLKMCENCDCRHWSISDSPCWRCTCESHWQLSWSWAKKQLHQYLGLLTSAYGLYWQIFDLYDGSKSSIRFGTEPLPKSDSLYLGPQVKINWEEVEDFDDLVRKLTEYILQDVVGTGHEERCVSDAEKKKERFLIVRPAWDIREIEGYSGCFCRCGAVLHIKTPKIKAFHNVTCPECGFVVQLFCGQE